MGADIYLNSVHDAHEKKFKPAFDRAVKARDKISRKACVDQGLDPKVWGNDTKALDRDPVAKAAFDKAQEKVSAAYDKLAGSGPEFGYFRDPYNGGGLYTRIGRSWWQDVDLVDQPEWRDEKGEWKPHFFEVRLLAQKAYRQTLRPLEDEAHLRTLFDAWVAEKRKEGWTFQGENQSTVDEWWENTKERLYKQWIPLVDKAIELEEPLYWSV